MSKENKWDELSSNIKVSKRKLLKVSDKTLELATLNSLARCFESELSELSIPSNTEKIKFTKDGEWKKNTCPRNCHDTCSISTQVIDGKVIRIKGDDTNTYTDGNLCVKMNHYVNYLYDSNRLMYPMKRVGKKGEGKFERITWEDAYKEITMRTKEILKENGPNSIQQYSYSGGLGYVQNYGMPFRFFNKLGASTVKGNICLSTGATALSYTYGGYLGLSPERYVDTKMYVSWGTNEAATAVHSVKFIKECQLNGGKIVVINPTPTPVSDFADMYIKIKPGTDTVLALSVANIIISEGLYDKEYCDKYTLGLDKLKEEASKYPVEIASEIIGVPEAQILEFAREYGMIDSSVLRIGYGIQRHANGGSILRAISFLPALTGMIGKDDHSGMVFFNDGYWQVDFDKLGGASLNTNEDREFIHYTKLGAALNGDLKDIKKTDIKELFVFNGNPMASVPNVELIRKGLKREDLFTVVSEIFHTETVDYADIVLPATTFFEHEDINQDYLANYIKYNEQAIEPIAECKSNHQMFMELAKEMGFTDTEFTLTESEIISEILENAPEIYEGLTYNEIKEKHWHKINTGVPYGDKKFKTPSGKIEFYSENINKDWGLHAVAEYKPAEESKDGNKNINSKYPLQLLTLHSKNLINGQLSQLPHIQSVMGEPTLFINPIDADVRGLQTGDKVIVKNDRGDCKLVVKVEEERVLPGFVLSYACPWGKLFGGKNINSTTSDRFSDIGEGSSFQSNLVEVIKA